MPVLATDKNKAKLPMIKQKQNRNKNKTKHHQLDINKPSNLSAQCLTQEMQIV